MAHINGFSMHHRDTASGGSPVVFIHGGFPSLATLRDRPDGQLEPWECRIAERHRLLLFSRRGFHPSACPRWGYAIENQAADLVGLLDVVGVEQAHVIASSAGGPIGYCAAARFPERVRSLLLVGTGLNLRRTLRDRPDVLRVVTEQIDRLRTRGAAVASRTRPPRYAVSLDSVFMSDEFAGRGDGSEYEQRLEELREWAQALPPATRVRSHTAELQGIEAYMAWDGAEDASAIRCPSLVLHGEADRAITVEEGGELAQLIPTARLETFPASHSLLWRHAPALSTALGFLMEVDASVGR